MRNPVELVRGVFDIRRGEHLRLWSMFFYLMFVLFAYYIVKPVSRAMFLTNFEIDKLPLLYILIAVFGGLLAYFYSKLATRVSLGAAVSWAMGLSIVTLVVMWWLIRLRIPWMVYVLNIWVSLFSVILVSQGWLVAGNLFDSRQAKRLYPVLNMGMVLGAAFGGEFTRCAVRLVGTESLLLASAFMVLLAYLAFLTANRTVGAPLSETHVAAKADTDFSFLQIVDDVKRVRHLQIIVGMMVVMYLVDTLVEYQFQVVARSAYKGDNLTAFFGQFYGLWLNGVELIFQLFFTSQIIRWLGIGATLQISPVTVALSSLSMLVAPGVIAASGVRLTEASTRYTLSKTGMELLYMPLPLALRNRIKAFIDVCVDRSSRGIGGVLLLFLTTGPLHLGVKGIAVLVITLSVVWIICSVYARKEYVASTRSRFAARRLDLASVYVKVTDRSTIELIESAATASSPRQALYALSLLTEALDYDLKPMLGRLIRSPFREVRDKVYEIAAQRYIDGFLEEATVEIAGNPTPHAVVYALATSPRRRELGAQLLQDDRAEVVTATLEAMRTQPDLAEKLITLEWLDQMASSRHPQQRALAAVGIAARGDDGTETLHYLLDDVAPEVVLAALRAAGTLKNRAYTFQIVRSLGNARLRRAAIRALTAFGHALIGTLSDVLNDEEIDMRIRRQIPRVLKNVPTQQSVNILLSAVSHSNLNMRLAALKALNRLRETAPQLDFDDAFVEKQLLDEARAYYELNEALAPFRAYHSAIGAHDRAALTLFTRSMEERLKNTLSRLFRLLELRYPPKDIYSAYLAISRPTRYDTAAALEFLDSLLNHNLKRVLLPLLDAQQFTLDRGREIFGIQALNVEQVLQGQIESGDPWLSECAAAAARELNIPLLPPSAKRYLDRRSNGRTQFGRESDHIGRSRAVGGLGS
jgi:ATP:ADP antiporter, AAA family